MTAIICPTVTARTPQEYQEQVERIAPFAVRIHIDVADGIFTPVKLTPIEHVWWPGGVTADIHVMYKQPFRHAKALFKLQPQLIIVHAEAEGDFVAFAQQAHEHGIAVGVALKPGTQVSAIAPALEIIDHVLVFSGNLGHFGGQADTHLLTKVLKLKRLKRSLEIGWDGGINDHNAAILAAGGVDVLNTGGFIHHAPHPANAYEQLTELASRQNFKLRRR
jgi:ribulose-phosphate 3-epimerase